MFQKAKTIDPTTSSSSTVSTFQKTTENTKTLFIGTLILVIEKEYFFQ